MTGSSRLTDWLLTRLSIVTGDVAGGSLEKPGGLLQGIDPRIKLAGLLALVVAAVSCTRFSVVLTLLGLAFALGALSYVRPGVVIRRVWMPVLMFTGLIALPAIFTTPGERFASVPLLGIAITVQGLRAGAWLVLRAGTSATLSALLLRTTSWSHILKSLRALRVPVVVVVILGTAYRYLFLLLRTAEDMSEARRSRTVGALTGRQKRGIAGTTAGVLLDKSYQLSSEVHLAMRARGYRGEHHTIDNFRACLSDWFWLAGFLSVAVAAVWVGR